MHINIISHDINDATEPLLFQNEDYIISEQDIQLFNTRLISVMLVLVIAPCIEQTLDVRQVPVRTAVLQSYTHFMCTPVSYSSSTRETHPGGTVVQADVE